MRKGRLLLIGLLGVTSMVTMPMAHAASTTEKAAMTGSEEVPTPGPAGAKGTATITLDDGANTVCYELTYEGISQPTAAHIHTGAKGVAGPVAVNFDLPKNGDKGCVPVDPTVLAQIRDNPEGHYVNIHTKENPTGAMRGQLSKV
ncbi:MAG TPA: CHRD domain-containing protein [Acidimicrobiia bacterium]|nr:CHRD domain-containing protein [Acidimicrobiia bacterium]